MFAGIHVCLNTLYTAEALNSSRVLHRDKVYHREYRFLPVVTFSAVASPTRFRSLAKCQGFQYQEKGKFCSNKLLSIAIECPELKVLSLEAKPREPFLSPRTELRQKFKRVTTRLDFQTLNTSDPTRVFRQLVDEFGGERHK